MRFLEVIFLTQLMDKGPISCHVASFARPRFALLRQINCVSVSWVAAQIHHIDLVLFTSDMGIGLIYTMDKNMPGKRVEEKVKLEEIAAAENLTAAFLFWLIF